MQIKQDNAPVLKFDFHRIRQIRESKALKVREAAGRVGMSPQHWHDLEAGRRPDPQFSTIIGISEALQCSLYELLAGPDGAPLTVLWLTQPEVAKFRELLRQLTKEPSLQSGDAAEVAA